jgi:cytochrome c
MAAHPDLATDEAAAMASYILDLAKAEAAVLPLSGDYVTTLPEGDPGKGVFILRAAYQDKGAKGLPSLSSEKTVVLRNANVNVHSFDVYEDVNKMSFGGNNLFIPSKSGCYVALKQVSLNGVTGMTVLATAPKAQLNALGGTIEIRLDGPDGPLVGASEFLAPSDKAGFQPSVLQIPVKVPAETPPGLHDVYLVFTNPEAASGSLMVVLGTTFNLAEPLAQ